MKILFAASECVPFVKTGGLADVVGALPKQIRKSGEDVRVILPLYSAIDQKWRDQMEHVVFFYINLGWRRQYVAMLIRLLTSRLMLPRPMYSFNSFFSASMSSTGCSCGCTRAESSCCRIC